MHRKQNLTLSGGPVQGGKSKAETIRQLRLCSRTHVIPAFVWEVSGLMHVSPVPAASWAKDEGDVNSRFSSEMSCRTASTEYSPGAGYSQRCPRRGGWAFTCRRDDGVRSGGLSDSAVVISGEAINTAR